MTTFSSPITLFPWHRTRRRDKEDVRLSLFQRGNPPHDRNTIAFWQHGLRKALHIQNKRSSWNFSTRDRLLDSVFSALGHLSVVMVQSGQDWNDNHLASCLRCGTRCSCRVGNLLMYPLMGSCLVEVDHIRIEHALELLLMQDQQVIEAFLPHAPQEAFADRIGSWGLNRRFEDLDRARFRYPSKARPELAIVITNQVLRCEPIRGGFSQLLGHPGIGRRSGHAHVIDLS